MTENRREAIRALDDEIERVAPDERAFLDEIRFSRPAAETFAGRVRAAPARTTIQGTSRHRRTTR